MFVRRIGSTRLDIIRSGAGSCRRTHYMITPLLVAILKQLRPKHLQDHEASSSSSFSSSSSPSSSASSLKRDHDQLQYFKSELRSNLVLRELLPEDEQEVEENEQEAEENEQEVEEEAEENEQEVEEEAEENEQEVGEKDPEVFVFGDDDDEEEGDSHYAEIIISHRPSSAPPKSVCWPEYKIAVSKGVKLTRKFFMSALKRAHMDHSYVAEEKMRKMIEHGFTPCLKARNYLIRSYCRDAVAEYHEKNFGKSFALQTKAEVYFEDIFNQNLQPLQETYHQLLSMYSELDKPEIVESFFDNNIKRGFKPNRATCNAVISTLRQLSKPQKALSVFHLMCKNKIRPNFTTYLLMFPVFLETDDLPQTETVYKKLGKFNIYKEKMFVMYVKHKQLHKAKGLLQERIRLRDKYGEGGVQLRNLLTIVCGRKNQQKLLPRNFPFLSSIKEIKT